MGTNQNVYKVMNKFQLATQYRNTHGWEMPTRKLARIMYDENTLLFRNFEEARVYIGQADGKRGHNRKNVVRQPDRPLNPYKLPDSDEPSYEPYFLPDYERVAVLNDIHLPYHSIAALTACIEHIKAVGVDAVFLNGDILDFHSLSFFERDPKAKRFSQELASMVEFLNVIKDEISPKIYFKFGNHEERYKRFLTQKAGEISDLQEFDLETIIKSRFDCEVIKDKRIVYINGLPYVHGHEFGRGVFSPVNAARGLFNQAKHSAVKGDAHVTSEHTETDITGRIMTTYSIGCLCGLNPQWLPLNKWNHGFAIQYNSSEGRYRLDNRRIIKGQVI